MRPVGAGMSSVRSGSSEPRPIAGVWARSSVRAEAYPSEVLRAILAGSQDEASCLDHMGITWNQPLKSDPDASLQGRVASALVIASYGTAVFGDRPTWVTRPQFVAAFHLGAVPLLDYVGLALTGTANTTDHPRDLETGPVPVKVDGSGVLAAWSWKRCTQPRFRNWWVSRGLSRKHQIRGCQLIATKTSVTFAGEATGGQTSRGKVNRRPISGGIHVESIGRVAPPHT